MVTVCLITNRRYPLDESQIVDGGTLNIFAVVRALVGNGHCIDVFTRLESGQEDFRSTSIRVFRVPFTRSAACCVLQRDYDEGFSFLSGVFEHPAFIPDKYYSIHTHHWTSGISIDRHLPARARLIHTPHLLATEKARYNSLDLPQCVSAAEQALVRRANTIVSLSESEADVLRNKYGCDPAKILVAPNGVSEQFFQVHPCQRVPTDPLTALCVGRTCRQKGIDVLLDAVDLLSEAGMEISMRLVGGSYSEPAFERALERRLESPRLHASIKQVGQVAHSEIPSLIAKACVYVQPSRYESQGIALLEAMAAGRVVIAANIPATREYIRDGVNGFLVQTEDADALAQAFRNVIGSPPRVCELTRAARDTARQYTWPRMLGAVLPILTGSRPKVG